MENRNFELESAAFKVEAILTSIRELSMQTEEKHIDAESTIYFLADAGIDILKKEITSNF